MPNATRPRLVQRRWWLYPWPVAKVTQFTCLQSASILQFQPHVWSPNPTFPLNAPWCQGNNQKSQLHPQSRLLPDLSSICRAKNSPTRPGREGITARTSSTCQNFAELPELSGRHVDRPKPKKLADSNAAFVGTLYTCAVVDQRSQKADTII